MTHDPREALERERAELIDLANRLIGLQTLTFGSSNIIAAISLTETERDSIVSALQTVASSKTPPAPILQSGVFKISKSTPVPSDMTLNRKFYPWQELDAGEGATLVANENYWGGRPTLDTLEFIFINDTNTQVSAIRAGSLVSSFLNSVDGTMKKASLLLHRLRRLLLTKLHRTLNGHVRSIPCLRRDKSARRGVKMAHSDSFVVRDRRPGYLRVDNDLYDRFGSQLGPYGLAVYMALCRYVNQDSECWPSYATIAKGTGMSKRKVI